MRQIAGGYLRMAGLAESDPAARWFGIVWMQPGQTRKVLSSRIAEGGHQTAGAECAVWDDAAPEETESANEENGIVWTTVRFERGVAVFVWDGANPEHADAVLYLCPCAR